MKPITGLMQDGQMVPDSRPDWPDGTRVNITPVPADSEAFGIEESASRDDPESFADWTIWLGGLEPLEFTPEEEAERVRYREAMRQFNTAHHGFSSAEANS